ncbi:hypothetical protein F7725_011529 [Dissostichus mawsoni]|uniref:Uncharacterized protein n=1 Tax=Dissostichus mawsoni TaxID=36200 RepID=A0A7J5ZDB6_DISMA|nr:hypothetical protein F7725_011529 [Dissostichus mawsoni]
MTSLITLRSMEPLRAWKTRTGGANRTLKPFGSSSTRGPLQGQGGHPFLIHLMLQEDQNGQGLLGHPWHLSTTKIK